MRNLRRNQVMKAGVGAIPFMGADSLSKLNRVLLRFNESEKKIRIGNDGVDFMRIGNYTLTTDPDIQATTNGGGFGGMVTGWTSGNLVLKLKDNGTNDAAHILSGGGNYTSDETIDTRIASFYSDGKIYFPEISDNVAIDSVL